MSGSATGDMAWSRLLIYSGLVIFLQIKCSSDKDGLWTAMYMAAQCHHFAVTSARGFLPSCPIQSGDACEILWTTSFCQSPPAASRWVLLCGIHMPSEEAHFPSALVSFPVLPLR
jgi:hypothetical protein